LWNVLKVSDNGTKIRRGTQEECHRNLERLREIFEEDANLGCIYENVTYVTLRRLEGLLGLCVASDGKNAKRNSR
jgi:hypothetical protein